MSDLVSRGLSDLLGESPCTPVVADGCVALLVPEADDVSDAPVVAAVFVADPTGLPVVFEPPVGVLPPTDVAVGDALVGAGVLVVGPDAVVPDRAGVPAGVVAAGVVAVVPVVPVVPGVPVAAVVSVPPVVLVFSGVGVVWVVPVVSAAVVVAVVDLGVTPAVFSAAAVTVAATGVEAGKTARSGEKMAVKNAVMACPMFWKTPRIAAPIDCKTFTSDCMK